jgi:NAD+ synthase
MRFEKDLLQINCGEAIEKICSFISQEVIKSRKNGVVVGLSGGVDSTLTAALCTEALGKEKVIGLILPEKESSPISAELASKDAARLGIKTEIIEVTSDLASFGVYAKRDEVIRKLFPEYQSSFKFKIILPADILERDSFNFYTLVVEDGTGRTKSIRLDLNSFRQIVASTNIKQRTRMVRLYYTAEASNYLVCGTTNKSELIQGFFVKYGDGGVDIEPIADLYKVQVYQLAKNLGISKEIIDRAPTPDTYSLEASDQEFYFRIPYETLDLLLYAWEHSVPIPDICFSMNLKEEQVKRVFRDLTAKYNASKHLRMLPPSPNLDLVRLV